VRHRDIDFHIYSDPLRIWKLCACAQRRGARSRACSSPSCGPEDRCPGWTPGPDRRATSGRST
jgi:hypothetical protein